MRYYLLLILLLTQIHVSAQRSTGLQFEIEEQEVSKLIAELAVAENDTLKVELLTVIASYYLESQTELFIIYQEQLIELTRRLKMDYEACYFQSVLAYAKGVQYDYVASFNLLNEVNASLENTKDQQRVSKVGQQFFKTDDPHVLRKIVQAFNYRQYGLLYMRVGNDELGLEYLLRSLQLVEELGRQQDIAEVSMDLLELSVNNGDLDKALNYGMTSLESFEPHTKYYSNVLGDIAIVYMLKVEYEQAHDYFMRSLSASTEYNNVRLNILTRSSLAELYILQRKYDEAKKEIDIALKLINEHDYQQYQHIFHILLAEYYNSLNDNELAYPYLFLGHSERDSLLNLRQANVTTFHNTVLNENLKNRDLEAQREAEKNRRVLFSLLFVVGVIALITFFLFRTNRIRSKANRLLKSQKKDLEVAYTKLQSTQKQLIHSEKMASLGALTAGIAHEIQNPLNFVNNFSDLNSELIDEQLGELKKGDVEEAMAIANDIKANEEKVTYHGKRAEHIVKSMLLHSRTSSGEKELTDINDLTDEYLRLSYHGLRAKDNSFNADFNMELDPSLPKANVVPQDIGRVLLNLINNAFQAVSSIAPEHTEGAKEDSVHKPLVTVITKSDNHQIIISVKDNGPGIPDDIKDKIFQPFFTTKPTGEGTGLGLSMSYDIITKGHGGMLKVISEKNKGSEFIIFLPINQPN